VFTFPALLARKFARPYARHFYTFRDLLLPDWRARTPPGYEMVQVDQVFLARQYLAGLDDVREWTSSWIDFARWLWLLPAAWGPHRVALSGGLRERRPM
jgi:hypothetical protein